MTLTIPIDVPPQGRPRFTRTGIAYDPPKAKKFKQDFAQIIRPLIQGHEIFTGALSVELKIFRAGFRKGATSKRFGDIDNLAKILLDAITQTGAVWLDDRQIVDLHVTKAVAAAPRVEISIEEINHVD